MSPHLSQWLSVLGLAVVGLNAAAAAPFTWDPVPNPAAVVLVGNARFTVLTPAVVRMEWSPTKTFDDRASWSFQRRNLPVPFFNTTTVNGWFVLETTQVTIRYNTQSTTSFDETNLQVAIQLNGATSTWTLQPGYNNSAPGNLLGTIRTLDDANGPRELNCFNSTIDMHCEYGLVSTTGIVVVDDTNRPRFDNGSSTVIPTPGGASTAWPWIINGSVLNPPASTDAVCQIDDFTKQDCGAPGISDSECLARGCCLSPSTSERAVSDEDRKGSLHSFRGAAPVETHEAPVTGFDAYDALAPTRGLGIPHHARPSVTAARVSPAPRPATTESGSGSGSSPDPPARVPGCYYPTNTYRDLYTFAHGHNYRGALADFIQLAGPIPLPPRYAFGVYYSRYWAFSDQGQKELVVDEYDAHNLPLDVLVTDMDWHITFYAEASKGAKDPAGNTLGWTGFTWDSRLFPNPSGFLDYCKARGLKNTLNLHPASGIQRWEEFFVPMCNAMGVDPTTTVYVPFNATDPRFVRSWMDVILLPRENEGVDFWWLDWQQGEDWIPIRGANPTYQLNYIFFTYPGRWGAGPENAPGLRPHLLHRWGGLGNHRYTMGFSGDVVPSWASLQFQPYFTATAANVGYGYWSHDLGGHVAPSWGELYTRWVQWGALSPVFRTHCTKNADNFRRIWLYEFANYRIMRNAMLLRWRMLPYLYTQAALATTTGVAALHPLYYDFPELAPAYDPAYQTQYALGECLVVAPVTSPMDNTTQLTAMTYWVPPGQWYDLNRGWLFQGPLVIAANFSLEEWPVLVRSGCALPQRATESDLMGSAQEVPTSIQWALFPGNSSAGSGWLYDDDGDSSAYETGATATTTLSYSIVSGSLVATIGAAVSNFAGLPAQRRWELKVNGVWPAASVFVVVQAADSAAVAGPTTIPFQPYGQYSWTAKNPVCAGDAWSYDANQLALYVRLCSRPTNANVTVTATPLASSPTRSILASPQMNGFPQRVRRAVLAKQGLDNQWGVDTVYQEQYPDLIIASETAERINYNVSSAAAEFAAFQTHWSAGILQVQNLSMNSTDQLGILALLTYL